MTFAWYGFQCEHPEDWAPALVSGTRDEGYVRIASPDVLSYQIRWSLFRKGSDLKRSLDEYLNKLSRDAKKLKARFSSQVEKTDDSWTYRWNGAGNGKGTVATMHGRTFFLEASATSQKSVQPGFQSLKNAFQVNSESTELWSVFGLTARLRPTLSLERHLFQSGRTRLEWRDKVGKICAERWGFGEQILAKHTFEEWARESMLMKKANINVVPNGLELTIERPLLKIYGLAKLDLERNQLITLRTSSRTAKGRPSWDWLI